MNPLELKIGNFVHTQIGIRVIVGISETAITHIKGSNVETLEMDKISDVLPLNLTEEWLLKFGFEWKNNGLRKNDICVRQQGGYYCIFLSNEKFNFAKKLEYVHQLLAEDLFFNQFIFKI